MFSLEKHIEYRERQGGGRKGRIMCVFVRVFVLVRVVRTLLCGRLALDSTLRATNGRQLFAHTDTHTHKSTLKIGISHVRVCVRARIIGID